MLGRSRRDAQARQHLSNYRERFIGRPSGGSCNRPWNRNEKYRCGAVILLASKVEASPLVASRGTTTMNARTSGLIRAVPQARHLGDLDDAGNVGVRRPGTLPVLALL